jgi:hypothetical protein
MEREPWGTALRGLWWGSRLTEMGEASRDGEECLGGAEGCQRAFWICVLKRLHQSEGHITQYVHLVWT